MEGRVQLLAQVVWNLVKSVRLSEVDVVDGYSRFRKVPILGVLRAGLGNQEIKELIVTLVLRLSYQGVSACGHSTILFAIFQGHRSPPSCC